MLYPAIQKCICPFCNQRIFSFVRFFPYALDLVFLRPHWRDVKNIPSLLSFLENAFVIGLLLFWSLFHRPLQSVHPLLIFFFFFSLSVWLLCGYTVPFAGAVVRYKSVVAPLFILSFILTSDVRSLFSVKLNK